MNRKQIIRAVKGWTQDEKFIKEISTVPFAVLEHLSYCVEQIDEVFTSTDRVMVACRHIAEPSFVYEHEEPEFEADDCNSTIRFGFEEDLMFATVTHVKNKAACTEYYLCSDEEYLEDVLDYHRVADADTDRIGIFWSLSQPSDILPPTLMIDLYTNLEWTFDVMADVHPMVGEATEFDKVFDEANQLFEKLSQRKGSTELDNALEKLKQILEMDYAEQVMKHYTKWKAAYIKYTSTVN